MSTETSQSLQVRRLIQADPATVFSAWTEPAQLERWSFPEGGAFGGAEVDLRVGGRFHLRMKAPDGSQHVAVGVYREIDRPRRLVFTWGWEGDNAPFGEGETLVTIDFEDRDGSTEVVLTHERFPNAESKASHEHGWNSLLNNLERELG